MSFDELRDPRTFRWVESGVSGLARPREWDAVAAFDYAGEGDESVFVGLEDGRQLVEIGSSETAACAAEALAELLAPPYRAMARRRHENTWATGAVTIMLASLPGLEGEELTYVVDQGGERSLTVDGRSIVAPIGALDAIVRGRFAAFVLQGTRLDADLWEVSVDPL